MVLSGQIRQVMNYLPFLVIFFSLCENVEVIMTLFIGMSLQSWKVL